MHADHLTEKINVVTMVKSMPSLKRSTHANCPKCFTNLCDYGQKSCEECGLVFAGHDLFATHKAAAAVFQNAINVPRRRRRRSADDGAAKPVTEKRMRNTLQKSSSA